MHVFVCQSYYGSAIVQLQFDTIITSAAELVRARIIAPASTKLLPQVFTGFFPLCLSEDNLEQVKDDKLPGRNTTVQLQP